MQPKFLFIPGFTHYFIVAFESICCCCRRARKKYIKSREKRRNPTPLTDQTNSLESNLTKEFENFEKKKKKQRKRNKSLPESFKLFEQLPYLSPTHSRKSSLSGTNVGSKDDHTLRSKFFDA